MATRPDALGVFAPAKINLFLHVVGRRPDGYHDLESLVAFADVGDDLTLERAREFSIAIAGPFAAALRNEGDNLVLRAARGLAARTPQIGGAKFQLTKNLPVASGIGGGSANAAAAIRGLLALYGERFASTRELFDFAASIGSDVPVCIDSEPAWMEGRGERVSPAPSLPAAHLVLVNPGASVSTADVFRNLKINRDGYAPARPAIFPTLRALVDYLALTRNDLEAPAIALAPVITSVLDALSQQGALFARMSGSGATCFGVFTTEEQARAAAHMIASREPSWWCVSCQWSRVEASQARKFES